MTTEPGNRAPAPGPLRLVQRFVNTADLEDGPDLLADAEGLRDWLVTAELLQPRAAVTPRDHDRALDLREALRDLAAANAGLPNDGRAAGVVNTAAHRARLAPVFDGAHSRLEPAASGVDAALGQIVAAFHAAVAEGTWPRLKACERDVCRWAFYDHSKNRSGHWCSMEGCGSREKNRRAYRRRRERAAR